MKFLIGIIFIITLIVNVNGQVDVCLDNSIKYYKNGNKNEIIINKKDDIPVDIKDDDYFIIGVDDESDEERLILLSPQNTRSIVWVMLEAMQSFICNQKRNNNKDINGKILISSWGTDKICDEEKIKNVKDRNNCPSVALQGTTNFAYRFVGNEVISLDDYFEKYMTENQTIFSTRFMKQAEYDYSIDGKYVAVPFITDIRMMYYNIDTFSQCSLSYNSNNNWDWETFVKNVKDIDRCFEQQRKDYNPFDFYGLYDEEMKFLSSILRNYGVPVITSNNKCGFCKEQNMKNNTINALKDVVKPLFDIMKKREHHWCVIKDKNFKKWLDTPVDDEDDDDYINLEKNFNFNISKIDCKCQDKNDSDLECKKNRASNRTFGITFASPPRMSGETIENMKNDIKEALVPGNYSFLGGSGLMISENITKNRQDMAWEFIVHLTSDKYLEDVGNAASMISPYESLIDDKQDKKMVDKWDTHIKQLRNSYPISYPTRTSENFYNLETNHPIRLMFFDIFEKGTDFDKAINRTCKAIEYHLQPKCDKDKYIFIPKEQECSKGKLKLVLNSTTPCHDGDFDINDDIKKGVYVECYYENYDTVYGVIVLILVFFGITISVIYISLFTAYRNAEPIRKASYLFSVIIVIGSILIYISVLLDLGYPNGTFCVLRIWFMVLGFGCSLGGLVVKAFRIYSIFNNRNLTPLFISDKKLLYNFFIIMIVEVICLSIWTRFYMDDKSFANLLDEDNYYLKSPIMKMDGKPIKGFDYTTQIKYCPSYSGLSTVFLIYGINCVLILAGCFFSIKTWSIPQPYSETKFMGSSIFMIGFVVLVCIPTLQNQGGSQNELSLKDIQTRFLLVSFAVSFTCLLATGVFCVPKIYDSYNFYKEKYYKQALEQNSNSLEYSTTNNNQIKFILENNGSKNNKGQNKLSINLSNGTLKRAAAVGNTLIDGSILGNNSKNHRFSMLNSELNSTSMYHKRVTRCQIINNELHCPDCGCIFEVTE